MSFVRRKIDLTFQLGKGSFGDSGFNTVDVTGLRVRATVKKAGSLGMNTLEARVYGLDPNVANKISTLGKVLTAGRYNTVILKAGDADAGMAVAFIGIIDTAWSDYTNAPDSNVLIRAHTGLLDSLKPMASTSIKGSADAATMMQQLAAQMGYKFENNGVSVQLTNEHLNGTGRQQAMTLARDANINILFDDAPGGNPTLAIWPKTGSRGGAIPMIGPTTGLVSYPTWVENGLNVKSVFNPSLLAGGQVQVQSSVANATGTWTIFDLEHSLESETYGGDWFTTVGCTVLGHENLAT